MRVAITGGAGFIGANLVRELLSRDRVDEVVVIDDLSTGAKENLTDCPEAVLFEGTILDPGLLDVEVNPAAGSNRAGRPSVPLPG